ATAGRPREVGAVLLGALAGAVCVALAGLLSLAIDSDRAIVPATTQSPARYTGLGANPNTMAMVLAIAAPLALWALLEARSRRGKGAAAAVLLLLLGSV